MGLAPTLHRQLAWRTRDPPDVCTFLYDQDRLCNLGAEPSRNKQKDSILTEVSSTLDVKLEYTLS
jgi:hypothetical protein